MIKEAYEKVKAARSADDVRNIAKDNGYDLSDDEAAKVFTGLRTSGELSDDELNISGGGCGGVGNVPTIRRCPRCGEAGNVVEKNHNYYIANADTNTDVWTYEFGRKDVEATIMQCPKHGYFGYDGRYRGMARKVGDKWEIYAE